MLDQSKLKNQIYDMCHNLFPVVFEEAMRGTFTQNSESTDLLAKNFGETIDDMLSEPFAEELSLIIDSYIKNANIYGTVLTVGSPSTQTAQINSPNVPINGKVPNTLGIK